MSVETWGELNKSQIDSEKIEEAIARLIAEHESDPDSHLGEGEALQSHRAAEIIDHVVGSVVADKLTHTQKLYITNFDSLDSFIEAGDGALATIDWPGLTLQTSNVVNRWKEIYSAPTGDELLNFSKNPFFQTILYLNILSDVSASWYWGYDVGDVTSLAFGFRVNSGNLQAVVLIGETLRTENITGITISNLNTFRSEVDSTNKIVSFYVNGILKTTIEYTESPPASPFGPSFYIKTLVNSNKVLISRQVILAHD